MKLFRAVVALLATALVASSTKARADLPPLPRAEPPVVVLAPPPPEPAPVEIPSDEPAPAPEKKLHAHGFEFSVGPMMFTPDLARLRFTGSGTIKGVPASFNHEGRELGLRSPTVYGAQLEVAYLRRYFAAGLVGFAGKTAGPDAAPLPPGTQATSVVAVNDILAYGLVVDLAGAIPLGDVSLRLGPAMGVRGYSIPMTGYDMTTCHNKHGSYPCYQQASSQAQPFLSPRLRADWTPGGTGLFVGGYVAVDVVDRPTLGGGIVLGFHWANSDLAP